MVIWLFEIGAYPPLCIRHSRNQVVLKTQITWSLHLSFLLRRDILESRMKFVTPMVNSWFWPRWSASLACAGVMAVILFCIRIVREQLIRRMCLGSKRMFCYYSKISSVHRRDRVLVCCRKYQITTYGIVHINESIPLFNGRVNCDHNNDICAYRYTVQWERIRLYQ